MASNGILADPGSPTLMALSTEAQVGVPINELPYAAMNIQVPPGGESVVAEMDQELQVAYQLMEPGAQAYLEEGGDEGGGAEGGGDEGGGGGGGGGDSALSIAVPPAPLPMPMFQMDALFAGAASGTGSDLRRANTEFECSDLMIKMLMLSRHFPSLYSIQAGLSYTLDEDGRAVCDMYNNMIANIAFNRDESVSSDCADTFRSALIVSYAILEHAVYNPIGYQDGSRMSDKDVHRLDMCMVDMLRTCCFIGTSSTHSSTQREYSKISRSMEAQLGSKMCSFMRSGNAHAQQAYATADKMFDNFDKGLANLKELTLKTDQELVAFLNNGKEPTKLFMNCFMFPTIFDGNRMRCANAIAARFYGPKKESPHDAFGTSAQVAGVFDSNSNMVSMKRVVYTVCAILSMAKLNLWLASSEAVANRVCARASALPQAAAGSSGKRASEATMNAAIQAEASKLPQWQEAAAMYCKVLDIASKKMRCGDRPDAPGANADIIDFLATWFEGGARCADKFSLLSSAFTHDAFCIDKPDKTVRQKWREFRIDNGLESNTNASLWLASQFLVSCRLEVHDISVGGSNILTAACIVFSGAISRLVDNADDTEPSVRGPFKFAPHVESSIKKMFASFGPRIASERVSPLPNATTETQDQTSKSCKSTKITNRILNKSEVRKTHEKSDLVATRLSACMFVMSVKEMLMADIDPTLDKLPPIKLGVTASLHEGRKDLRRMYIIALQTLPCLKYARCRKMNVTHLIEQNRRSPESKKTTGDNVEKPWRDIVGGMLISTILYPSAGQAFISALCRLPDVHPMPHDASLDPDDDDDDDTEDLKAEKRLIEEKSFVCRTHEAVNVFRQCFKNKLGHFYPLADTLVGGPVGPVRDGMSHARVIMGQQIAFAINFIKCIENCGPLWECLQLTFSIQSKSGSKQGSEDGADDDEDGDDDAFEPPPLPPLAGAAGPSALAQVGDDDDEFEDVAAPEDGDDDAKAEVSIPAGEESDDEDLWEPACVAGGEQARKSARLE